MVGCSTLQNLCRLQRSDVCPSMVLERILTDSTKYILIANKLLGESKTVLILAKVDTSLNISDADKKKNRVIIIGAGFNGIGMGCLCKMAGLDFIIIDRAQGVGGTWWYNRFPGAQVDVFSHTYSFTFLSYYGWTNNYSYCYEILNYIRYAVLTFGLEHVSCFKRAFSDTFLASCLEHSLQRSKLE